MTMSDQEKLPGPVLPSSPRLNVATKVTFLPAGDAVQFEVTGGCIRGPLEEDSFVVTSEQGELIIPAKLVDAWYDNSGNTVLGEEDDPKTV
jgi:hypothetical protein